MIVWQGRGIITPVLFAISLVLFAVILNEEHTPIVSGHISGPALIFTGAISFILGKKWRQDQGRTVIDKATGKEIVLKAKHTFFWIDIMFWGYICMGLGLVVFMLHFI